jgi:hypothetical protein
VASLYKKPTCAMPRPPSANLGVERATCPSHNCRGGEGDALCWSRFQMILGRNRPARPSSLDALGRYRHLGFLFKRAEGRWAVSPVDCMYPSVRDHLQAEEWPAPSEYDELIRPWAHVGKVGDNRGGCRMFDTRVSRMIDCVEGELDAQIVAGAVVTIKRGQSAQS